MDTVKIPVYRLKKREILLSLIFIIWLVIWVLFTIRPFFKKGLLKEYKTLSGASLEEKRSYVTGDSLYELLLFTKKELPPKATFMSAGLDKEPLDGRRAAYYLYPLTESSSPEYILVFGIKDFSSAGYENYRSLDGLRYILKKKESL